MQNGDQSHQGAKAIRQVVAVKLTTESDILNVASAYAPQQGCMEDDKEEFREELEAMIRSIPEEEDLMIGSDLNGHVEEEAEGYEECHRS